MRTFILTVFFLNVAFFFIRLLFLSTWEFPHKRDPQTMGGLLAEILGGVAIMIWAAIILWILPR